MQTGLIYVPSLEHSLEGHPEHAGRLTAVANRLQTAGVWENLHHLTPHLATAAQLHTAHGQEHVALVEWAAGRAPGLIGADTYVTPASYSAARLAAGSCCTIVDALLQGQIANGLALVRPPGHHAGWNSVEGFCLFNNIALAAWQARTQHGLERVLVLDFDVHHGNGTQQIFEWDAEVLFVSLHMFAPYFYPGAGGLDEIGFGTGRHYTLNIPFPPGVGDVGYERVLTEVIYPRVAAFQPQLILVSAGFDAHWRDPLAEATLSLTGYARMTRHLISWANSLCQGRILFILEGGYDRDALAYGVLNLVYALLGQDRVLDPLGPCPQAERDIQALLVKFKQHHLPA